MCQSVLSMIPLWAAMTSQAPTFPEPEAVERIVVSSGEAIASRDRVVEIMADLSTSQARFLRDIVNGQRNIK